MTRFRPSLLLLGVCAVCVFAALFALRWRASSASPTPATTPATNDEAPSSWLESKVRLEAPTADPLDAVLALESLSARASIDESGAEDLDPGVILVARVRSARGPAAEVDVSAAAAFEGYAMRSPEGGVRNVTRRVQNAPRSLQLAELGRSDRDGRVEIDVTSCFELSQPAPLSVLWVRVAKSGAVLGEFDVPVPVEARLPRPNARVEIAVELLLQAPCAVSGTARTADDPALRVGVALFETVRGVPEFGATAYATPESVTNGFRFSIDCDREWLLLVHAAGYRSKRLQLSSGFSGDIGEIKLERGHDSTEGGGESLRPVALIVGLNGQPAREVAFRALDAAALRPPNEEFRTDREGRGVVWLRPDRVTTLEFALPYAAKSNFVFAQRHIHCPSPGEELVLHIQL